MATKRTSSAKKKGNVRRYAAWPNGDKYLIVDETDKAYICENTQFFKTNPYIAIFEEAIEEKTEEEQPEAEEKEAE